MFGAKNKGSLEFTIDTIPISTRRNSIESVTEMDAAVVAHVLDASSRTTCYTLR